MNKRILLITTFFYPQNRIPVLRVGQWAKYWSKMGYDVTVLTTEKYSFMGPYGLDVEIPSNIKVIEIDYLPKILKKRLDKPIRTDGLSTKTINFKESKLKRVVRSLRGSIGSLFNLHDLWISSATKKGLEILDNENFDYIVSSYSPSAVHEIAAKLKKEYPNIKWIADFRDLWAYNHLLHAKGLLGTYEKYKEKKTIKDADVIVTVSDPLTNEMRTYYPYKLIKTIENGFDPEEFDDWELKLKKELLISSKIIITYAGTIYEGKRDPSALFTACNNLIEKNVINASQLEINFYGNNEKELLKIIEPNNYNKFNIINIKGFVSREESLKAQKNSTLLLFLEWNDPSAVGVLTGKLFEYIVSGTPILAVGIDNKNSAGNLIEKTATGVTTIEVETIEKVLLNILQNKKIGFYQPNIDLIKNYSRDKQAKNILELAN